MQSQNQSVKANRQAGGRQVREEARQHRKSESMFNWKLPGAISLLHVATYFLVGSLFLTLTRHIPESRRTTLDFFQFYQPFSVGTLFTQAVRGLVIGLVCLPLFQTIRSSRRPWLLLTGVLWGIGVFGSVEPLPGSFEGLLYTITTPLEHGIALFASLVQFLLLSIMLFSLLPGTEQTSPETNEREKFGLMENKRYLRAFTLFHVATYFVVGAIFYNAFSVYQDAMETMELFQYWRPLENMVMPLAIFFGQFIRGLILALLFQPFYTVFFHQRQGWIALFTTIWGMTFLSAVSIAPWILQEMIPGYAPVSELLVGMPEVTVQMLLFSLLIYVWQRRRTTGEGFQTGRSGTPSAVHS